MNNETLIQLITASVSPAVMISGASMLVLAFLGRQGVLAGRLRELHERALHHAELFHKENNNYHAERAALSLQQAKSMYSAVHNVKWTLIFLFAAIIAYVLSCISLGATVFFKEAVTYAAIFFVLGMAGLFSSAIFAMSGAVKALSPLKHEQEETEKLLERIGKIKAE